MEQLLVNIQSVKQQIVQQKWKIGQLQKQATPSWPPVDQYKDFPKDFAAGLQVKDEPFNPWRVAPPPPHPPPTALPLLDAIGSGGLPSSSVDLVTGAKSHSGMPSLNPPYLADNAWSMPAWPSHSSTVAATTSSLADSGSTGATDSKTSGDVDGVKGAAAAGACDLVSSSTAASDAKQPNPCGPVLDIEEFIPGKPWQGPSAKGADEDPYMTPGGMTPGSMSRGVFNMSSIIEPHIFNALGRSNVGLTPDSHWLTTSLGATGSGAGQNLRDAVWASGGPSAGNQLDHQSWAQTSFSKNTRPPPGLQQSFNRSVSWTPGPANRGEWFTSHYIEFTWMSSM